MTSFWLLLPKCTQTPVSLLLSFGFRPHTQASRPCCLIDPYQVTETQLTWAVRVAWLTVLRHTNTWTLLHLTLPCLTVTGATRISVDHSDHWTASSLITALQTQPHPSINRQMLLLMRINCAAQARALHNLPMRLHSSSRQTQAASPSRLSLLLSS